MPVATWLSPDGPIAAHLSGFELRPEQRAMADAIAEAFAGGTHLAVEAGTGVGKTFAYLLPAIDEMLRSKRRVVVSTHTIALQEQLIEKDIPFLQDALQAQFAAELVKGRQNYVGLRRLKSASERQKSLFSNSQQLRVLHSIEDWAYETGDGSLADLPLTPPLDVWEKVRSEHNNCLGRRCPTYLQCFYQRARRRAESAHLLVVNHALLVSDVLLRRDGASVLPDYDLLVIDEAHTLAGVATSHLSTTISNNQVQYLLAGLFNERTGKGLLGKLGDDDQKRLVIAAQSACNAFFRNLLDWQRNRGRSNGRLVAPPPVGNDLSPALEQVAEMLKPLKSALPREEDRFELGSYLERAEQAAASARALLEQAYEEHVYWIEAEATRTRKVSLCGAPLDPGPLLREWLFDRVDSAILTSATLATAPLGARRSPRQTRPPSPEGPGDDAPHAAPDRDDAPHDPAFDYLLDRLGAPPTSTRRLGSPFNFAEQVTVHVEAGMPDPSAGKTFTEAAARAVTHYLRRTEGRAFVLFTSYQMLNEVAAAVDDDLGAEGYTILAQGGELSRSRMLERLREDPRTALFGTDSFWQGVDVVGEALSNVIIVKLPFAVPDRPMVEARIDLIRQRGGNPFKEFQVPEAILKFRQGFGRLIRSRTDRGIVVILDPRVTTKSYGRQFLESLPECQVEVSREAW